MDNDSHDQVCRARMKVIRHAGVDMPDEARDGRNVALK